jgi:hypothetical protein
MNMGGEGDVGRRIGMYLTVVALGVLAGPPTSGAINARTGGFEMMGAYAGQYKFLLLSRHIEGSSTGGTIVVGACGLVVVRYLLIGGWRGKV